LFSIVKYLGAGYLVYLGVRAVLQKAPTDFGSKAQPISVDETLLQAILAEVLNPKTALFFLEFFGISWTRKIFLS